MSEFSITALLAELRHGHTIFFLGVRTLQQVPCLARVSSSRKQVITVHADVLQKEESQAQGLWLSFQIYSLSPSFSATNKKCPKPSSQAPWQDSAHQF